MLGAGAWGTAIAVQIASLGHKVSLWGRDQSLIDDIKTNRINKKYLNGVELPNTIELHKDITSACEHSSIIICVVPTDALRSIFEVVNKSISVEDKLIAWACKGIESKSSLLPHQIASDVFGKNQPLAVIGGPSFATEMAYGKPTAITVASSDDKFNLAGLLHGKNLRVYTSHDIIGVEIGGALKNVIAIAAGISDSLEFGANAKAALLTRGLNEILNLAIAVGGSHETILGLSGLGDLALSCGSIQSRNYQYGMHIAKGMTNQQALQAIKGTVEGISTTSAVIQLACTHSVQMPICEQIKKVIDGDLTPIEAVKELLSRPSKTEKLFQ